MYFPNSISEVIPPQTVAAIMDTIERSEQIVITTHSSPDGDALGSTLALYHFLKRSKKQVRLIVPNSFPYFLKWMEGTNEVDVYDYNPSAAKNILSHADLIFCLDYNIPKRTGDMALSLESATAKKILIDHHLFPGNIFDITVSHPEISSTSELIFRLFLQAGKYDFLTKTEAECIYCGMMTDTGGFTFNSNNPEIFEIISLLLRKKIDKDAIYSQVYHNFSEARFRLLGFTLSQRMEVYPHLHSALLYLSKEDQAQFSFRKGDTEGFVNYPLNIKGIIFSTFIREDDGLIKLSFRSQHTFPCNEFAAEFFNGGGEHYGTFEEALHIYREGLKAYESKLKETMMLL
jgi:phosphoesterase RecJ-like protein